MGSAVSAPIERQVNALRGRRYMRGMRPEKYFEVVVKKEHGKLLDILGFSDDEAFALFVQVFYWFFPQGQIGWFEFKRSKSQSSMCNLHRSVVVGTRHTRYLALRKAAHNGREEISSREKKNIQSLANGFYIWWFKEKVGTLLYHTQIMPTCYSEPEMHFVGDA